MFVTWGTSMSLNQSISVSPFFLLLFEVLTVVNILTVIFWVVMLCNFVGDRW